MGAPQHVGDYGADIADYSAVRMLVLLDNELIVKPSLVIRNLGGGLASIAKVRVVKFWAHPVGAPLRTDHDFSDWGDADDIDGDHNTPPPRRATTCCFDPLGQSSSTQRGLSGNRRSCAFGTPGWHSGSCRALGSLLFPSVPLWTFVAGALSALGRALSLAGVPQIVIRDLPLQAQPATPPPPPSRLILELGEVRRSPSCAPSLEDLLLEEEHEVSARRRRARRKRAHDSAAKTRRNNLHLAAKEDLFYVDATAKATRVKVAQLYLARAYARMKEVLMRNDHTPSPRAPHAKFGLHLIQTKTCQSI